MESQKHPSGPGGPEYPSAPSSPAVPPDQAGQAGHAVPGQRPAPGTPPPASAPVPARPAGRGWSRARLVVAVLGGVLALLCVGGAGVGLVLYNQATKPDRSAPDVAVSEYLRALFVDRDDTRIRLFECADAAGLAQIRTLRTDIEAQEKRLDTQITVSWGELAVQREGDSAANVTTSLRRTADVDGSTQSLVDDWRFRVVDDGGWRVCGAERLP